MFGDATPYRGVRRLPFGERGAVRARSRSDRRAVARPAVAPRRYVSAHAAADVRRCRGADDRHDQRSHRGAVRRRLERAHRGEGLATRARAHRTCGRRGPGALLHLRAGSRRQTALRPPRSPAGSGCRTRPGAGRRVAGGPTLENFVAHVRQVSAQIPCWEMSAPRAQPGIVLSGLTGESLRTNYPKMVGLTTAEDAEAAFARYRFGRYHYVRDDVLDELQQRSRRLFRAPLDVGCGARRSVRHLLRAAPAATLDRGQAGSVRGVRVPALLTRGGAAGDGGGLGTPRAGCVPRRGRAACTALDRGHLVRAGNPMA